MDKYAFIEEVYHKLTNAFMKNINDTNKEMLSNKYKEYLHQQYDKYFFEANNTFDGLNKIAVFCVEKEKTVNLGKSPDAKYAFLIKDESYEKLQEISFEIFGLATAKHNGENVDISLTEDEYVEKLTKYLDNVSELFRYSAEKIYSDAVIELRFIFEGSKEISFRLH